MGYNLLSGSGVLPDLAFRRVLFIRINFFYNVIITECDFMLSTVLENLRLLYVLMGLCLTVAIGIMLWRVRGILNWKRSLRQEVAGLYRAKYTAEGPRKEALNRVIETCESIWRNSSPDLNQIRELPDYVRKVAAAFFPDAPRPELCLSIGRLLSAAQGLTDHIALLLQRPAFGRLGHLRIRQVHQATLLFSYFSHGQNVLER